ncbi:hypothetical protein GYB22_05620 [bacterium]|nr:hypothetical protein [bacterium]
MDWHLKELENQIQQSGWKITARLPGDNYSISGIWEISRNSTQHIEFNGLDDMETRPIERAYGCRIKGTDISLYFHGKGETWEKALTDFVDSINELR